MNKTKTSQVTPRTVALTWFKQKFFPHCADMTPDDVAELVTELALMHPEQISAWMDSVIAYRDAEGFTSQTEASSMWQSFLARPVAYKATRSKMERGAR